MMPIYVELSDDDKNWLVVLGLEVAQRCSQLTKLRSQALLVLEYMSNRGFDYPDQQATGWSEEDVLLLYITCYIKTGQLEEAVTTLKTAESLNNLSSASPKLLECCKELFSCLIREPELKIENFLFTVKLLTALVKTKAQSKLSAFIYLLILPGLLL